MRASVISGCVLGTRVYRGFAPLAELAQISQADIYDQDTNPLGTQREIQVAHARRAYRYTSVVKRIAFFPEVVLNARDPQVVRFHPAGPDSSVGELEIDEARLSKSTSHIISRIDGNHRLHFANGDRTKKLPPLTRDVGFCLVLGLTQQQEAQLFLDINGNQRGMSTSHLDNLQYRLTPEKELIERHFDLLVAERLCEDPKSPFLGLVHKGGKGRPQGLKRHVNLRSLRAAMARILKRSSYLRDLPNGDSQYAVIRCYWSAVRTVFHHDWTTETGSLLLRGLGVAAMAIVGADIIDRCLLAKEPSPELMAEYLRTISRLADWSTQGEFGPYSGIKGAETVAKRLRDGLSRGQDYDEVVTALARQL